MDKILEKRESRKGRKGSPYSNFYKKIQRSFHVVYYTEDAKGKNGQKIKSEARKQFIVSLVTAFEVYLTDVVLELIDTQKTEKSRLLKLVTKKYTLTDIDNILSQEITIGELICEERNFQNMESTFSFLDEVFEEDFKRSLEKNKFQYQSKDKKIYSISMRRGFFRRLKLCLKLRHSFVHDVSFSKTPSFQDVGNYCILIMNLAICIDVKVDLLRGVASSKIIKR